MNFGEREVMEYNLEKRVYSYEPIFGTYRVVEKIGVGGYGEVFALKHENSEDIADYRALKVISVPKDLSERIRITVSLRNTSFKSAVDSIVEHYQSEIDIMRQLRHGNNILTYQNYAIIAHPDGEGKDILILMDLMTSLSSILNDEEYPPLSSNDVIRIGIDLCNALIETQKKNVIHRDIKPDNIFVSETGVVKLGDFGTAKIAEMRGVSSERGTLYYAAPEIIAREQLNAKDTRCDIYSLGIVLYELMNGYKLPFLNETSSYADTNSAFKKRRNGERLLPPKHAEENQRLIEIILKACEHNPDDRYFSAVNMRDDLTALLDENERRFIPKAWDFGQKELVPVVRVNNRDGRTESANRGKLEQRESNVPKKSNIKKKPPLIVSVCATIIVMAIIFTVFNAIEPLINREDETTSKEIENITEPFIESSEQESIYTPTESAINVYAEESLAFTTQSSTTIQTTPQLSTTTEILTTAEYITTQPPPTATQAPTPVATQPPTTTQAPQAPITAAPTTTQPPITTEAPTEQLTQVDEEIIYFADKNLEAVIRKKIGKSTGEITTTDVKNITDLDLFSLDGYGITDISSLEYFVSLEYLWLDNNNITDISILANLTNLTDLRLSDNNISDISALTNLTNLKKLYLSCNYISDISPLKDLTQLTGLELSSNNISDISPLKNLTQLIYLYLESNNISDISVLKNLTQLTSSGLSSNNISDISALKNLTNLKYLNLLYNNIDLSTNSPAMQIINEHKARGCDVYY